MRFSNAIDVDRQKLEDLLNDYCAIKHIDLYKLGEQAGYSRRYFYDILNSGRIRRPGVVFLETVCNIKLDQYELIEDEIVEETVETPAMTAEDIQALNEKLDTLIEAVNQIVTLLK